MQLTAVDMVLFVIILVVLIVPFKVTIVEHNLEAFLFVMGAAAVTVSGKWSLDLVELAVKEPVERGIVPAVLVAGLLFHYGSGPFQRGMNGILRSVPLSAVIFAVVVVLGLISSVITAIIAALFLVEIVNLMPLERKDKINLVIIACFSIGLGAALTPLGEPLSTIAVVKLAGPPYNAGFWYLFDHLGILIFLGVAACGVFSVFWVGKKAVRLLEKAEMAGEEGGLKEVIMRALKVYAFVAALFLLGAGMEIIINKYFIKLPAEVLFWINMVSAILDNATLTAAEIGPSMAQAQITAALMGLLVSGGMLIPGNIPNIISAGKLGITSGEWAKLGIPLGLVLNLVYFVAIFFLGFTPRLGI
jgi:predicted cation transporter